MSKFYGRAYYKISKVQENDYAIRYLNGASPTINGIPLHSFLSRKDAEKFLFSNERILDK